jgi:hypothetical protein
MRRLALIGALGLLLLSGSSVLAATNNNVWRATLTSASTATTAAQSAHGGATIVEVGNGRLASVAVKLYGVKPDSTVQVTVTDSTTSTPLAAFSKFKMAATGVNRFWLKGSAVKPLDAAIDARDTLTISVIVTPRTRTGSGAASTSVTLSGTFTRVR